MKIKPLKWDDAGNISMARTPFGNYRVTKSPWGAACTFVGVSYSSVFDRAGASVKAAKRAAEADWQERVNQCIEI